ncbi:MAG: hypothetical protein KQH63_07760 [Desulfobulbaceae bacterium]|nr:hypothetical protein [Desulfobulbaceae bacterium]
MNQSVGQIIAALALLTSLCFIGMEIVDTWQSSAHESIQQIVQKEQVKSGPRQQATKISFYPPVPTPLPDLNEGYPFNEQRYLADPDKVKVEEDVQGKGIEVDLEEVMYNGSILIGDAARGLISYPDRTKVAAKKKRSIPRTRLNKRARARTRINKSKQLRAAKNVKKTVRTGDVIGGFRVASILPEKIVFQRGDEQVEKMLFDQKKKRIVIPKKRPKTRKTVRRKKVVSKRRSVRPATRRTVKSRRVVRSLPKSR